MNTITMTVELCAEDRARLDSILEQLKQLTPMSVVCDVTPQQSTTEQSTTEQTAPAKEPEQESATAPAQESKPTIKLADLQALVQELAAPGSGKRDKVKALVKGYAERVSLIPEDKWPEVYAALTALKEG